MTKKTMDLSGLGLASRLAHAGREAARADGTVNPPVQRATTLLFDDVETLYHGAKTYALEGMAAHEALCEALLAVEGGAGAVLAPSGLAACTLALLTVARGGGEVLVVDSVYKPTRNFSDSVLERLGISVRYYDPRIGEAIAGLITDKTCAIMLESPGSLTFEVQDVPAIVKAARARGVATIIDNTWSAGVYFKPFDHGVDISVQALSKYQGGHADVLMGAVIGGTPHWAKAVLETWRQLGLGVSADDAYLVLRGMRSLSARLERHAASALQIARWIEGQPQVSRMLCPALESSPDHALWKRDFTGASGLFAFVLKPAPAERVAAMLESLKLFGLGFSWGGFESLAIPCDPQIVRTAQPWRAEGQTVRLSIGLEDPEDLKADLAQALARI
ncbi:MAG: cystathionine beta-lyase [Hyphomonadaceae bacterium]